MADKITIRVPFSQSVRALGRIGRVGENVSRWKKNSKTVAKRWH